MLVPAENAQTAEEQVPDSRTPASPSAAAPDRNTVRDPAGDRGGAEDELVTLLGTTLADAELRFEAVVESLSEGLAIFDRAGVLKFCNSRFEQLTGYTREEMLGKRVYEIFFRPDSPEQYDYFREMLTRYSARRKGVAEVYQSVIYRKDGERRVIEIRASPLLDAAGRIIGSIGANLDITERALLEEQLRWSQRTEAVGRLAGGLARDFNNYLTAILGVTDLLLECSGPQSTNYNRLQLLRRSALSACALTQELATLGRPAHTERSPVELRSFLDRHTGALRELVRSGAELTIDSSRCSSSVFADERDLHHVVSNLVSNAGAAVAEGGRIEVSAYDELFTEARRTPRGTLERGRYAMLSVTDDGHGIDPAILSHIFDPFFTTHPEARGLGLSTAHAIVHQLGGDIVVETADGGGSTFSVILPAASLSPTSRVRAARRVGETVLLVVREPIARRMIADVLAQHGYEVRAPQSPAAALEMLRGAGPRPSILVTDLMMRGVNGLTLVNRIIEQKLETRVIFLAGMSTDAGLTGKIEQLGIRCLTKPFAPHALIRLVRSLLDS